MRKTLSNLDTLQGKKVLLRVDLNVPVFDGKITDYTRIDRVIPTLKELHSKGAKTIILSHFGRPKGQVNKDLSIKFLARELAKRSGFEVDFTEHGIPAAKQQSTDIKDGNFLLLENIRFYPGEESNDQAFAKELAGLADIYVNDAFSCAHRAHASTEAVAHHLPAYAGISLEAELAALEGGLTKPKKPVMAIVGGSKVSSKLAVLEHLLPKVDTLVIGGAMANTFLEAQGINTGRSLVEEDMKPQAAAILEEAKKQGCEVLIPNDAVIAPGIKDGDNSELVDIHHVPADQMILDVGPQSLAKIIDRLNNTKTLLWNGPLGAFEFEPFGKHTFELAHYVAKLTKEGKLFSVAGGGDTVSSLETVKCTDSLSYVSTAGGAFLEWMEGKELPGIKALEK